MPRHVFYYYYEPPPSTTTGTETAAAAGTAALRVCVFSIYILFFFTNDYLQIIYETSTDGDDDGYMTTNASKKGPNDGLYAVWALGFFLFFC